MTLDSKQAINIKRIGHYEILHAIGKGGMGIVYLALDARLNRHVAIKCLHTELCEPSDRERFKREALLLAKLNHSYIVHLYDVVESAEQLALVMEYVDGSNLQTHLREHIIPYSQRMKWLIQIAQGLAVAHDADIIHRDLKTENILINSRLEAKISDLGIAKYQESGATITDHVAGSYCAMSPEQAKGETLDCRSDLFSFGILMYQLLCGCHPFGSTNNKLQLIQRIISQPPISPNINNPNLPAAISDLLGQLLAKDPNQRPANTHWLVAQLEKIAQIQPKEDVISDDTLPLSPTGHNTSTKHTIKHPTFANSSTSKILQLKNTITRAHCSFIALWQNHKPSITLSVMVLLLLSAFSFWQLQPKPPKYIAVIPPRLTTTGMTEEQQELLKTAVFEAIQRAALQLDSYYLIPAEEIEDIEINNENITKATAADELITTDIECKIEVCNINLTRLVIEENNKTKRLRVKQSETIDVLTDNYLSISEVIQENTHHLYPKQRRSQREKINQKEYIGALQLYIEYQKNGATDKLLDALNKLSNTTISLPSIQSLYKDVTIDLHHETKNSSLLVQLEKKLKETDNKNYKSTNLYNEFYLKVAQRDNNGTLESIKKITSLKTNDLIKNELLGYANMEQNDYKSAIKNYKNAIRIRRTSNNTFNLANAFWLSGNTSSAKTQLDQALTLFPTSYKTLTTYGIIHLVEGNTEAAEKLFEKSITQKPNDITVLSNLGLCYLLNKKYEKAEKIFYQAKKISPKYIGIHLNEADTQNLKGNIDLSKKNYQKIVNLINNEEDSPEKFRILAQAYVHLGLITESLNALEKAERTDPQNIQTSYTAALVHTLSGNYASALFNIEKTLNNGLNSIFFTFSWFDVLCENKEFIEIINKDKEHLTRCSS